MDSADHGEVDRSVVVYEIASDVVAIGVERLAARKEIERLRCFRIRGLYNNRQLVVRHNLRFGKTLGRR